MTHSPALTLAMVLALYHPFCTPKVQSTAPPGEAPLAQLWEPPGDLASSDLFGGPWGTERAPDPHAIYTFVARKREGTNPGLTVRDPEGREWHVKQPPHSHQGAEGPIEVTLSRLLSAVGYHQPPVYLLSHFTVRDATGTHVEPGGRFRLTEGSLRHVGTWSWQQNPFVGTRPYQGLLVMLMIFNSSDIKNDNNALYDLSSHEETFDRWYVVRDLGTALGETGRFAPQRGDIDVFEHEPFIEGLKNGVVQFNYHGWHQELLEHISVQDVEFACNLLGSLSEKQWRDAFRAGGFESPLAERFIARLRSKLDEGRQIARLAPALPEGAAPAPSMELGARR